MIISNTSIFNTPITVAIDSKFCEIRLDIPCELSPSKELAQYVKPQLALASNSNSMSSPFSFLKETIKFKKSLGHPLKYIC